MPLSSAPHHVKFMFVSACAKLMQLGESCREIGVCSSEKDG